MRTKRNVFQTLDKKEVCYAVGVSKVGVIRGEDAFIDREYYIIASREDRPKIKRMRFRGEFPTSRTIERTLTDREVEIFKKDIEKYIKVHHDKNGRVYEVRGNGFKRRFKQNVITLF